ncbi:MULTISPECIES: hypothetical protein [Protofrankia]|uniref:Adhesin domain-containing protein n=1 Tax=Candidatus Protofrankia datiscae TaxID=2716812 RepID=F8AYD7_9ACTN|nr:MULTISPECIES: hypothetical protein [Protofrankia]AEH10440.1 hypothetical protein FsymDg_3131 [Candidatus Protofrankia datiscae]
MTDVLVAVAAAVLLGAAGYGLVLPRRPPRQISQTVDGVGAVEIQLAAGRVEIAEADRADARVAMTVRRRAGRSRPALEQVGELLRIDGRTSEARVRLTLPRATRVRAEVRRGEVTLWGSDGDLVLITDTGTIAGRELGGAGVAARSRTGDVVLHFARPPGKVAAYSDSGAATAVLPGGPYAVDVESADPDADAVTLGVPVDPRAERTVSVRSRSGRVRVCAPTPQGPVRL